MFPRHTLKLRARARLSLLLVCALALSMLPNFPAKAALDSATRRDDDGGSQKVQSVQVPAIPPGQAYRQTNLVSDVPGLSPVLDPLLVNPWGISSTSTSPFWVVNNGTSTTQLLRDNAGAAPFFFQLAMPTVTIPCGLPTGTVANATSDFNLTPGNPARFIFDSITGKITGWNPNVPAAGSTTAVVAFPTPDPSSTSPCSGTPPTPGVNAYTGLAIGSNSGGNRLYAADFADGGIDVFDGKFVQTTVTGGFIDATIPAAPGNTYHPYNIQNLGGSLYVTYAKVGSGGRPEVGVGNGFVRKFNTDGVRDLTFAINNGPLNAPWGITIAPASFGVFGNALLVGNFGEGGPSINAFNPTTGAPIVPPGVSDNALRDESGNGIVIDELWALSFGNGAATDANTLYFNAGIGEEEHGLTGKLNPTTTTATSLIQFATTNFSADEASGHVDFTVVRTGDTSNPATVNFNTFDESQAGHASQKSDYEIAAGTLTFAPGETSKTFRILIVDDKFVEGDEVIDLMLSNPTGVGVGLGSPNVSELTILENDAVPLTTNPIDDPTFFVRQHYLDFFNREPDASAAALVSQLTACGADTACINTRRREISSSFFTSNEFFGNGSLISHAHKAAFGPVALNGFSPVPVLYGQFEIELQAMLNGVAIGSAGAAQLEANKQAFFAALVASPEFVVRFPTSQTPTTFANTLFTNAGFTPTTAERQAVIDEFGGASNTADQAARARALRRVAENATFAQQEVVRDAVMMAYFGYDRRDPDTAGFNFVVDRINNSFGGDFQRANLINMFMKSSEYRQRFGPDGITVNQVNNAPTANNDTATASAATPVIVNVLANDTDPEGDYLTVQSVAPGTGGTPTISADKRSITFTPAPGFAGTATFQYTITDNGYNCSSIGCGPFDPLTENPKTSTATVTLTINSAGTFQFGASTATVGEGDGKATITVTLAGGSTSTVTVDYATAPDSAVVSCSTVNGQASERCDYNTTIGTLRFAPGETSKTFDIFITDDARVEGSETFTVSLSNPTGGATFTLGTTTTTTVTITDNDAAAGPNPIDNTTFFVRQHYIDFLNREPDAAGLAAWVSTINGCAAGNTSCDRVSVSSAFFRSDEFQARGYFAIRFYRAAFARDPVYREFVGDMSRLNGTTPAESAALKTTFVNDFVQRPEFIAAFGSLTNAQFVDKLIANTGVTFTTAQRDQFVADLNSSAKTRAQVLRDIVEASQFSGNQAVFNRAFVLTEYFGYLRRDPDTGGFNAWLTFLNANPNSFRTMVSGFVNSQEYRLRFGAS